MEKPFRIFEITEALVNNILSNPYEAHLHDFEEIIIIAKGSLEHYIDFKVEMIEAPVACYVSMGWRCENNLRYRIAEGIKRLNTTNAFCA